MEDYGTPDQIQRSPACIVLVSVLFGWKTARYRESIGLYPPLYLFIPSLIAVTIKVQSAIITPENAELIRQYIFTLLFTLKNIESISSDISGLTGDEATRRNLKLLIKSLSRIL